MNPGMIAWMNWWMNKRMNEWMNEWMNECMNCNERTGIVNWNEWIGMNELK